MHGICFSNPPAIARVFPGPGARVVRAEGNWKSHDVPSSSSCPSPPPSPRRRDIISTLSRTTLAACMSFVVVVIPPALAASSVPVLRPSDPAELVHMINAASPEGGAVIDLGAGEWRIEETLQIRTPNLTLRGAGREATTLVLNTDEHYVPAIAIASTGTCIDGIRIRHRSPSVANNFAVYLRNASDVTLSGLSISSETGTGLAIEGGHGTITVSDCDIHDTKNNGIGLFGDVGGDDSDGGRLEIVVEGTTIDRNGKEAVVGRGLGERVAVRIARPDGLIRGGIKWLNCEDAEIIVK